MERDFMGLNSNDSLPLPSASASVKREISDDEAQWPFMKKAYSLPHFSSFGAGTGQNDGMNKMVTEPIKSSAFMPRSAADSFDCEVQNFSLSLSNPIIKPSFPSFGQNAADATRQQIEGVPKVVTSPAAHVVGFTEPWNHLKSSTPAPQMTIFYGGTVSVYEGMSPEKAQAIMLLAGNGSFLTSNPSPQIPSPGIKIPSIADGILPKQPDIGLSNPLSVSSHCTLQSGSTLASKDEQAVAKTTEISPASVSKPENQRVVPSRGPVPMPAMTPAAVPQFRKASLARFLEKRKERVVSTGPYICEKKQQDGIIPGSNNVSSAMP